jgi:hypothetical protein
VRAVEDGDPPGPRQLLADPPEEVVPQLLLGRPLERGDLQALRVESSWAGTRKTVRVVVAAVADMPAQ